MDSLRVVYFVFLYIAMNKGIELISAISSKNINFVCVNFYLPRLILSVCVIK